MNREDSPFELVRHPLKVRRLVVARVRDLSPRMRRITLGGPELEGFVSLAPEDHVKLLFPAEGQSEPALPIVNERGEMQPPPGARPIARDYTIRARHADTVDIDFLLHGHGVASSWAGRATPGDVLGLAGPRGSRLLRLQPAWQLFVGDETALPEMTRRLEETPATARNFVVALVEDTSDQVAWPELARPGVETRWVHRADVGGAGDVAKRLVDIVRATELPDAGDGFAWLAGEASETSAVMRLLVRERGWERARVHASGHWKRGVVAHDHHEPLG
ncbi:siderophore-interacting protein [Polyangium mundeleinium]|uniref:Siderophore-interacting protein n=1 Tax=Polyangium mundeleinium TaxID=2995306 RepID=A0ABT5EYT0_9BACT|nr:siderophore-interacting protein [Polyangium mundeleinium]MDC0746941.1 siderophore-interacting protein [Polyangium mundeleinium]